jgi:hypothetical protein
MKVAFMSSAPNSMLKLYVQFISEIVSAIYLLNEKSSLFFPLKPNDNTAYEILIEPYIIKEHIARIFKTASYGLNVLGN